MSLLVFLISGVFKRSFLCHVIEIKLIGKQEYLHLYSL